MTPEDTKLSINIRLSDDNELITLLFTSKDRDIHIGFNLQEAQILGLMLSEAVTTALLKKMQLFPDTPENLH